MKAKSDVMEGLGFQEMTSQQLSKLLRFYMEGIDAASPIVAGALGILDARLTRMETRQDPISDEEAQRRWPR